MVNFENSIKEAYSKFKTINECHIINQSELNKNVSRSYLSVWKVFSEILNKEEEIEVFQFYICFPYKFPLCIPDIYLSSNEFERYKYMPHVDLKHLICTFSEDSTTVNPSNPYEIVKKCFDRAKSIIEEGLQETNQSEFKREFEAYWEQKYSEKDSIANNCLSLITSEEIEDFLIPVVKFNKYKLRSYDFIIYENDEYSSRFIDFLKENKIKFFKTTAFYIGEIEFEIPPYDLKNKDVLNIISNCNNECKKEFKKYINSNSSSPIIVFKTIINGYSKYFAWQHRPLKASMNGFRKNTYSAYLSLNRQQKNQYVKRISPDTLTPNRIVERSSGKSKTSKDKLSFFVSGLGSIGSNMIYFLNSFDDCEFKLNDIDLLKIENIGRHLLGFSETGCYKTKALKNFLSHKNPLQKISTMDDSIIKLINSDPEYINKNDFAFIAIGDSNIENFVSEALHEKILKTPTFFVWVEPYLCGGHVVFINLEQTTRLAHFHDTDGLFKNNIIDKSEYKKPNPVLNMQEAGCQSTFTPYSLTKVVLFLSSIFPKIYNIISGEQKKSCSYSWVGNKDIAFEKNIQLSNIASKFKDGDLIENIKHGS